MVYRTRTYIAADWESDLSAVDQLKKWNESEYWSLTFTDAHKLTIARDDSLYCSIKKSIKNRLNASKRFVLIVGEKTKTLTAGGCQYCNSYNGYTKSCAHGNSVDYRSYIEYECDEAVKANSEGQMSIIVLYYGIRINKAKCPQSVRAFTNQATMLELKGEILSWDYQSVKKALER